MRHPDEDPAHRRGLRHRLTVPRPRRPPTIRCTSGSRSAGRSISNGTTASGRARWSSSAGSLALPLPDVYRMEGESGQTTLVNVRQRSGPAPDPAARSADHAAQQLRPGVRSGAALLLPARRALPRVALRTPAILHGRPGRAAVARRRRTGARRSTARPVSSGRTSRRRCRPPPWPGWSRSTRRLNGGAGGGRRREVDRGHRSVGGAAGAGPDRGARGRLPRDLQRGDPALDRPGPPPDGRSGGLLGQRRLLHAAPRARPGRRLGRLRAARRRAKAFGTFASLTVALPRNALADLVGLAAQRRRGFLDRPSRSTRPGSAAVLGRGGTSAGSSSSSSSRRCARSRSRC